MLVFINKGTYIFYLISIRFVSDWLMWISQSDTSIHFFSLVGQYTKVGCLCKGQRSTYNSSKPTITSKYKYTWRDCKYKHRISFISTKRKQMLHCNTNIYFARVLFTNKKTLVVPRFSCSFSSVEPKNIEQPSVSWVCLSKSCVTLIRTKTYAICFFL